LGYAILPGNVLSSNLKHGVTEVESLSNVTSIIPNPVVENNYKVGMNSNISTTTDKSSSLGIPIVPSDTMPSNLNELVTTSESGSILASIIPKSLVSSNPAVAMNPEDHSDGYKSSCLGDKSSLFGFTVFTKHCHAHK